MRTPARWPSSSFDLVKVDGRECVGRIAKRQAAEIEFGEAVVEIDFVGEEQLAVVGGVGPDDIVEKQFERRAQVGDRGGVEVGELFGVFAQVDVAVDVEPSEQEVAELGAGAEIGEHALGLPANLVVGGQVAGAGGGEQFPIRN